MDNHGKSVVVVEQGQQDERMHPLVALAVKSGTADPATLKELLAVQREWEAGEARKAYARALVALKRDLPTVLARDATVDYTSAKGRTHYRHTSLAAAMDAVTDPLTNHGFSLAWEPSTGGERNMVRVTCRLTHSEGHSETASIEAPADTSGSKNPAQAVASTITLLQRYTALSLLGIATADMPEAPATDTSIVDPARNLRAVSAIIKRGLSLEQAQAHLGRGSKEWTVGDLERLRAWMTAAATASARVPGEEG